MPGKGLSPLCPVRDDGPVPGKGWGPLCPVRAGGAVPGKGQLNFKAPPARVGFCSVRVTVGPAGGLVMAILNHSLHWHRLFLYWTAFDLLLYYGFVIVTPRVNYREQDECGWWAVVLGGRE